MSSGTDSTGVGERTSSFKHSNYTCIIYSQPGALLGQFDSAFGFDTGRFHGPVSGCTHRKGGMPASLAHTGDPKCFTSGTTMEVSAYRFHEEDPLAFDDGK